MDGSLDCRLMSVDSKRCGRCWRLMKEGSGFFIGGQLRCFLCAATYPPLMYSCVIRFTDVEACDLHASWINGPLTGC